MYIPKHYEMDDEKEMIDFMVNHPFGILFTSDLTATHLPFIVTHESNKIVLLSHMAKANIQWKTFENDKRVLIVFHGEHSYISSAWYEDEKSVPTWNYLAVHVTGNVNIMNYEETRGLLRDTMAHFDPLKDKLKSDEKYFDSLTRGVTAFRIDVEKIEGKKKLSQNHSEERRLKVINKLNEGSEDDRRIGELIQTELRKGK